MDFPHLMLLPWIIAFKCFEGKGLGCGVFILLFFHYLSPWLAIFSIRMKENYSVILIWPCSFNEPGKFIYPEISAIPFDTTKDEVSSLMLLPPFVLQGRELQC